LKERNRNRALEIEPGDRIVLYVTRVMAFAGSILVDGACTRTLENLAWEAGEG
jgi:hypothetical protein